MDILITCYRLDLTGSSTYTLTLATELKNRGHSVSVFSPFPKAVADEMRKRQISVHQNLQDLAARQYSFIIAQHNVISAMARSVLPETPMIFISHGKLLPQAYLEQPPPIDIDIRKYVAVSERIQKHLVDNHHIPSCRVEVVRNFVDTQRFSPRSEISPAPRTVLLLCNRCTRRIHKTVKGACRRLNLKLILVGGNKQVLNVEDYINRADIVISIGRGILEAMACGRAAIVYGYLGGDGMVTKDNIDLLKGRNFSGRVFRKNYNVNDLVEEIRKYDVSMGKINRQIVLREYNVSIATDRIIGICNDVLRDFRPKPVCFGEINRYLSEARNIVPLVRKNRTSEVSSVCHGIINRILPPFTKRRCLAKVIINRVIGISRVPAMFRRAFLWLVFSPHPRRFTNVWITFKAGGLLACYLRVVENFSDIYRTYRPGQYELKYSQSRHIFALSNHKPLFSVFVVLRGVPPIKLMKKCIESVRSQHYDNWELVLLGQTINQPQELYGFIESISQQDKRVCYYNSAEKNLGARLNEGFKYAKGKFIGFLEQDDELTPDALTWLVWAVNAHPDVAWFYSDEDRISAVTGRCRTPNFKPDFSAEFLFSNFYTGHFCVYSADVLSQAGGFTEAVELDPYYDMALRLAKTQSSKTIIHIPRVLYHKRDYGLFNGSKSIKDSDSMAGCNAVRQSLKRRNLKGQVVPHTLCRTLYQITFEPTQFPKVCIIIPSKNNSAMLHKCLAALQNHTHYPDYEVIIIDNQSDDPDFHELVRREQVRVIRYDKPFNHSDMNNMAIESVHTDWVVLMNNDVEILSQRWLEQLVATSQIDESIAMVGGLLLYPNGTVQHSGMIMGIRGVAGHAHKYMKTNSVGYNGRLFALQQFTGVTAALSLMRVSAFRAVGGFNAIRYPTSYNDADLCIRLHKQGFRCIYNPMVRAVHYECRTRPITTDELVFRQRLSEDHTEILAADPFYNRNLTLKNEQFVGFRPFPVEMQIPQLRDCVS